MAKSDARIKIDALHGSLPEGLRKPIASRRYTLTLALILGGEGPNRESHQQALTEENARVAAEKLSRLKLLAARYSLNPESQHFFVELAHRLAEDFVPGMRVEFKPRTRVGRPKKWTAQLYCQLIADIELVKDDRAWSDQRAIRELLKQTKFKDRWVPAQGKSTNLSANINALQTRLIEARSAKYNYMMEGVDWEEPSQRRVFLDLIAPFSVDGAPSENH